MRLCGSWTSSAPQLNLNVVSMNTTNGIDDKVSRSDAAQPGNKIDFAPPASVTEWLDNP